MRKRVKKITLVRSSNIDTNHIIVKKSRKRIKTVKKLSARRENESQQGRLLHIDGSVR